jgi:hypothetical protein
MSGIRLGDIPDMKAIVDLGMELLHESDFSDVAPDVPKFKLMVANMMGQKSSRVIVVVDDDDKPQGFLLGIIDDLFFSRKRYGTDIAFYIRKDYRHLAPKVLKSFIDWAKSKPKVVRVTLGISSGIGDFERVGEMYGKLGLHKVGGIYTMSTES